MDWTVVAIDAISGKLKAENSSSGTLSEEVNSGISLQGIAIGILCFVLLQKFKLSVPKVIGIAAVLGLVCFGVF